MALEKIIEKLENEKKVKIEEIREKREKEYKDFVAKKEKELEEWKEQRRKNLKESLNREESTLLSQLRLKYNTEKARIEVETINRVKLLLLEKIKSLSNELYNRIWDSFVEKESVKGGEIILAKGEDKIDVDHFCKKYGLVLGKGRVEGKGGFVIQKDNLVVDLTIDTIVEELVNKNILEIAQILRGEK